jgi:eukaryotic-like serine/threonine-protein kinase
MTEELWGQLEALAKSFLAKTGGGIVLARCGNGGSAAVFKVERTSGVTALKVYDPRFFVNGSGEAELRRLSLQKSLIGHECNNLVDLYIVEEAFDTAFVEMEFLPWPDLKDVLSAVPDGKVQLLIQQLVVAARFLEGFEIVHRDIKPENIKVSPDYSHLKLLDLGVARELERSDEEAGDATDYGVKRPFLATAQYSSPEYLFRLEPPSPKLWKALTLYQVGAVLHDLIRKQPIFHEEIQLNNKYLVAHAVLGKACSFPDIDVGRLSQLKALASSCLTKDMDLRLSLVDWSNFESLEGNALSTLREQISKRRKLPVASNIALAERYERLRFERKSCVERIREAMRQGLIGICGADVPVSCTAREDTLEGFHIGFAMGKEILLLLFVMFSWTGAIEGDPAKVSIGSTLSLVDSPGETIDPSLVVAVANASGVAEEQVVSLLLDAAAKVLTVAMQIQEECGADFKTTMMGHDFFKFVKLEAETI